MRHSIFVIIIICTFFDQNAIAQFTCDGPEDFDNEIRWILDQKYSGNLIVFQTCFRSKYECTITIKKINDSLVNSKITERDDSIVVSKGKTTWFVPDSLKENYVSVYMDEPLSIPIQFRSEVWYKYDRKKRIKRVYKDYYYIGKSRPYRSSIMKVTYKEN